MTEEAIKQALEKIIDGCENVKENKEIHKDAKSLAKLVTKDIRKIQALFEEKNAYN